MLDPYGVAGALFLEARRNQTAWNEDDAMWRMPDWPIMRRLRALLRARREPSVKRTAGDCDLPAHSRSAPVC